MKKLLLALAICASPVINVAASADKMYTDLVENIISNNETVVQKIKSLNRIQKELTYTKEHLQTKLLNQYSFTSYPYLRAIELMMGYLGGSLGIAIIAGDYFKQTPHIPRANAYFMGITSLGVSAYFICNRYLHTTLCTKKIKEIDTVLAKLDTLKKQLQTELYFGTN